MIRAFGKHRLFSHERTVFTPPVKDDRTFVCYSFNSSKFSYRSAGRAHEPSMFPEAALLEDGCEGGLGDIIGEGTVVRGFQLGAPFSDSEGQGFTLFPSNLLVEAGDQPSSTDGADGIPSMGTQRFRQSFCRGSGAH